MVKYKGHFKNENYDIDIDIINSECGNSPISFEVEGVSFIGDIISFELETPEKYDISKLPFTILKCGGVTLTSQDGEEYRSNYTYYLQQYEFEVNIPITVIHIQDQKDMNAYIFLKYSVRSRTNEDNNYDPIVMCDEERVSPDICIVTEFSLNIGKEVIYGEKTSDFETALLSINRQLFDRFELRCCFTCQFSEYSPYGNSEFGCMLCYGKHKEKYIDLNVQDKLYSYLCDLSGEPEHENKQEIQLCDNYAPRTRYGGYRGYAK
ncbi:MAG: hypothetical protein IJ071_04875 [Ruminococcus sp.]|nr:hypothetical protein [Ruminococcus sp.]